MSSALQIQGTDNEPRLKDLSPEYAEIFVLGKVLQASGYFSDVRDQAQAITKILYGRELGISPINSMSSIHIIEGKPALSSNLLAALIKRSGKYNYRVKEWDNLHCVLTFREKIDGKWEDAGESSFSIEDAKTAKVSFVGRSGGPTGWTKFPKAMLFARALSQGERAYCPDVSVCALYVPEELGAEVNETGEVVSIPESKLNGNVPRTTEAIKIASPRVERAAEPPPASVKGAETPKAGSAAQEQAVRSEPAPREPGSDDEPEPKDADECIGLDKQRALHRAFRDAIRNTEAAKQSDTWLRDWLQKQGYTDAEGKGTTKTIPMYLFEEVKKNAVDFAAILPK